MLTDEQKAAGWIEHDDGPCPVALDSRPDVVFRNGSTPVQGMIDAEDWEWGHSDDDFDIIAYRPENPHD